jgi:hypothetical protein
MASSELGSAPGDNKDEKDEKDASKEEKPKAASGADAIDWSKSSILDDAASSEPPADTPGADERPLRLSRSSLDLPADSQEEYSEDTLTEKRPPLYRPRRSAAIPSAAKSSSEEPAVERRPKAGELDNTKIGLVGGKGVGKTYLFHGIIYRTLDNEQAGAVSYYLHTSDLSRHEKPGDEPESFDPFDAVRAYQRWEPFLSTARGQDSWYRLGLEFRSGLLGLKRSRIELEFVDGSGEAFQDDLDPFMRKIWEAAFSNAGIMVFCLPIWAAFPSPDLSPEDQEKREAYLKEFSKVLANYKKTRKHGLKVRTILALTMADDDKRCSLQDMIDRWVRPYIEDEQTYLDQLRSRSGIPRYLANAHIISNYLHEEFARLRDRLISQIPKRLNFGRGLPWIIPMSAVEGKTLESAMAMREASPFAQLPANFEAPVPVHVELPLLAALCENQNALM